MHRKQGVALVAAAVAALAAGGHRQARAADDMIPATPTRPAAVTPATALGVPPAAPLLMDDTAPAPAGNPVPAGPTAPGTVTPGTTSPNLSTPVTPAAPAPMTPAPMAPAPMAPAPMAPAPVAAGTTTAPATAPATTAGTTPLMGILGSIGVGKGLSDAGISVTGFVEGGYTYDFSSPTGNVLSDRAFDTRHDSPVLDQVELNVSRTVDFTKPLDFGAQLEQIYGTDSAFIHSNGLTIYSYGKVAGPFYGTGTASTIAPRAQYDLTQGNFTISSNALFKGIAFEGGKFATLLGAELIDAYSGASTNAFYSHSFIFVEEPFTHTGALGIVNFNDMFTFQGGITRGWDQATEDTNGNIDFIGQVKAVVSPKLTAYFSGITGNEEPDLPPGTPGHNGYRTVLDTVVTYALSDQLTVSANGMYAWEAQTGNAGNFGGLGQWYAVAGYASYKLSDNFTFNARGEWFDDQDAAAPTQFGPVRRPNEYYEFTLGTTIHPLPNDAVFNNFFIRPEVRFDYADKATFDPDLTTGQPTDHYFFSFGVDGVFAF